MHMAYQNPVRYHDPSGNMPEAFDTAAEIAQADGPYPIADLAAGGYLIYADGNGSGQTESKLQTKLFTMQSSSAAK